MAQDSREDAKVQELIKEFKSLTTQPALRQWEKSHREEIRKGAVYIKLKFDEHWQHIMGESYLVQVTEIDFNRLQMQKNIPGRIDPKGNNYKTERIFTKIEWKKNVTITGRGVAREEWITYELRGDHTLGRARVMDTRCKPERLIDYLGETEAEKILKLPKKDVKGIIEGIELPIMVEGHWEVLFGGKGSKFDKDDVEIQWEGQCIQAQRQVPVILPGKYIEVLDNARYPVFMKVSDQPRKIVGWVQHFPFTTMREATKEEYDTMKAEGTRVTKMLRVAEETG